MFSRMTIMEFKPEKLEEGVRTYKESVIPEAKRQKGFLGAYLLIDRSAAKAISLTLWNTEKDAAANEDNLYYQEQLVKFIPYYCDPVSSPPIKENYEVVYRFKERPRTKNAKKSK